MITIAMAGGAVDPGRTGAFHGNAWCAILNGFDEQRAAQFGWSDAGTAQRRVEGGRIVRLYDPATANARRMAAVFGIDEVVTAPERLAEGVDAGIVVEDGRFDKLPLARPFLERGLPCYLDKPLALRAEDARSIIDLARESGAPLLSCSGWRFSDGARRLHAATDEVGGPQLLTAVLGVGDFDVYAIHPIELALTVLGPGVGSVADAGEEGRRLLRLGWSDGRQAALHVLDRALVRGRRFTLHGPEGAVSVGDLGEIHPPLMERFLTMCRTGGSPLSDGEMLEAIEVLEAARGAAEQCADVAVEPSRRGEAGLGGA